MIKHHKPNPTIEVTRPDGMYMAVWNRKPDGQYKRWIVRKVDGVDDHYWRLRQGEGYIIDTKSSGYHIGFLKEARGRYAYRHGEYAGQITDIEIELTPGFSGQKYTLLLSQIDMMCAAKGKNISFYYKYN